MSSYFVDKELYDDTEANFNDLTIKYEHLEQVADERMNTILEIEKYCIDEKEDLISGCEVCEDILKMIDKLKDKKYYIKNTYTKRQIDKYKSRIDKAIEYIKSYLPNYSFDHYDLEKLLNILRGEDIKEIPQFEGTLEQLDKLSINN